MSPLEVIRQVYAALGRNDLDALAALTSEEVEIYQSDTLPYGGVFTGLDGMRRFTIGVFSALDSSVEVAELFQAGAEEVIQVGRTRGTARDTGKSFDSPELHLWTVRHGKVTSLRAYVDASVINAALTP